MSGFNIKGIHANILLLRKGRSVCKQVYCVVLSLSRLHNYTAYKLIWAPFTLLVSITSTWSCNKQARLQIQCKRSLLWRSKHRMSRESWWTMTTTASVLPGGGLLFTSARFLTLNPATALLSPGFILHTLQILHTEIRLVVSWTQNYLWSNKADSDWNKCFCWAAWCLVSRQLLKECGDQTWAHTVKPAGEKKKKKQDCASTTS